MKLLSATFVCTIHYCTDDETFESNYTLPVALSRKNYAYMHRGIYCQKSLVPIQVFLVVPF